MNLLIANLALADFLLLLYVAIYNSYPYINAHSTERPDKQCRVGVRNVGIHSNHLLGGYRQHIRGDSGGEVVLVGTY